MSPEAYIGIGSKLQELKMSNIGSCQEFAVHVKKKNTTELEA